MKKLAFETYRRPNGHDEFLEWLDTLPKKDSAKLLRVIEETEENGMLIAQRLRWVRKLDTNLYELRSKVSTNIQRALYFHVTAGRYVITHGFTKKGDKAPASQIRHGKQLRKEWHEIED